MGGRRLSDILQSHYVDRSKKECLGECAISNNAQDSCSRGVGVLSYCVIDHGSNGLHHKLTPKGCCKWHPHQPRPRPRLPTTTKSRPRGDIPLPLASCGHSFPRTRPDSGESHASRRPAGGFGWLLRPTRSSALFCSPPQNALEASVSSRVAATAAADPVHPGTAESCLYAPPSPVSGRAGRPVMSPVSACRGRFGKHTSPRGTGAGSIPQCDACAAAMVARKC